MLQKDTWPRKKPPYFTALQNILIKLDNSRKNIIECEQNDDRIILC